MELQVQNTDYSRLLYRLLMEYGKISINGVGTFTLVRKPAEFNETRTVILPPQTVVEFSYEEDPSCMIDDILTEDGLTTPERESIIRAFKTDYEAAKAENKPFRLGDFGVLVNRVLVENGQGVFNKYYGLEQVSIRPSVQKIKEASHAEDFTYGLNYQHGSAKKENTMQYFWPALAALVTLFVLALRFGGNNVDNNTQMVHEVSPDTTSTVRDTLEVVKQDTLLKGSPDTSAILPQDSARIPDNPENDKAESNISKPAASSECVLIAGAFKNAGNAKRMIRKIRKKGYTPYEQLHGGLRRVGIRIDCNDRDPDKYKAELEKKMHQKLWYLKDTI